MFDVLEPVGLIALQERGLLIHATLLMLIVIIPVFLLTFLIAWRYRAGNKKATYTPDWEHSKLEELIWWAIPLEIILVLGALTWGSTHELDPYKSISKASGETLQVQVVALDWKWLFMYPELGIASVNELVIPTGREVKFSVTADAPMNSFWIPKLGGQIYAMTGMATTLHLLATETGEFEGRSANYSGEGFTKMKFTTRAITPEEFANWVTDTKSSGGVLHTEAYRALAKPSLASTTTYAFVDAGLFEGIVGQFMHLPTHTETANH